MKKNFILPVLAVLFAGMLSVTSCTKDALIVPYNLNDQPICLQPEPNANNYQQTSFDVTKTQIQAALSAAGITDLSRATKAGLKAGFKIKIDGTANLDDIAGVEVYMKVAGTGGLGDQVAYSEPISNGATEALLLINGTDLKTAISNDVTFTVKVLVKNVTTAQQCYKLGEGVIEISVRQ